MMLAVLTLSVSAKSVRYFTRPQAVRVSNALDAQAELMIYCGYEYELATYVIINEVWAEPVNSKYYEIWLFGYDAYTGEEIYMPIDLSCIWLYNAYGNRMYSAAQYLRFRSTVATPNFYWTMPPYNAFTRHFHDPMFNHGYTYHYEIHRYGWRPHTPTHGAPAPYHPYYMRTPHTPAPVPTKPFTPGVNYPQTADGHGYIGGNRTTLGTRSAVISKTGNERSGNVRSNTGNPGTTSRSSATTNTGSTTNRGSATTNTGSTTNRGSATTNTGSTTNRGSATTNTGSTTNRGSATTNTGSTTNRGSATTNSGSTTNRGSATTNSGSTTNRGSATTNSGSATNRGSATTNTGSTTSRGSATTKTGSTTNRGSATTNSGSTTNRGSATTKTGSTTNRGNATTNRGNSTTRK
jgi:hypothetical protein